MSSTNPSSNLNLEQQRKRAKDLRRAHREGQIDAVVRIARHLPRARSLNPQQILSASFTLSEAQFVIAREAGFSSWPSMKRHIEDAALDASDVAELLIDAAFNDNEGAVRRVLERDTAILKRSIFAAAAAADANAALALLDADPSLANSRGGKRDWAPLLYLCYSRYRRTNADTNEARLSIARRLLELNADVNAAGREPGYQSFNVSLFEQEEWHPIEAAAGHHDIELVRLLVGAGANAKHASIALSQAVRGGNTDVLRLLLKAEHHQWQIIWALAASVVLNNKDMARVLAPHINPPMATNGPALMDAIRLERDAELIEVLLGDKDSQELRAVWRDAYRAAIRYGQHEAAKLLRRRGADESAITNVDRVIAACINGERAQRTGSIDLVPDDHRMLAWAIRTHRYNAIPLLLEAGLDPRVPDRDGQSPLHLAVRANSIETVDALLRAGADIDARDFDGETPLDIAVADNHEELIRQLLAAGARPAVPETRLERDEMNILFERAADAVAFGDLETLRELLDEEPSLIHARSPRPHRATLLNYCGANGVEAPRQRTPENAPEVMKLLLDRGADVHATCNLYGGGATTMGLMISSGFPIQAGLRTRLAEILLTAGAIVDGKRGAEGIVGAATLGKLDIVKTLQPNSTKAQLRSAFFWACEYGRTAVVEFLIQSGADISAQGPNAMTGLHLASLGGHLETVRLLLRHKAPLEPKNIWGGTVLNTALYGAINWDPNADYVPIVDALLEAGAKVLPGVLEWWMEQTPRRPSAKDSIAELLRGTSL